MANIPGHKPCVQPAPQRFPAFATVEEAAGQEKLFLADLMPVRIDQMRGAFGSGRSFNGEATGEYDLGVRAPANLEYQLKGQYARFECMVSLHNPFETELCNIRRNGEKVRFTVYGDGKKVAETIVNWNQPTAELKAVVASVQTLRLETVQPEHPGCTPVHLKHQPYIRFLTTNHTKSLAWANAPPTRTGHGRDTDGTRTADRSNWSDRTDRTDRTDQVDRSDRDVESA